MAKTEFPAPLVTEPSSQHDITVILLHGRGSTSKELSEDFFNTSLSSGDFLQHRFPSVRWVFPEAKHRMSTVFQEEISEWYDVYSLTNPELRLDLQKPGLVESMNHITNIIDAEYHRLEQREDQTSQSHGLVLGGISMGCAVGIHVLLNLVANGKDQGIKGFYGWCGWLPFGQSLKDRIKNMRQDQISIRESMRSFYCCDIGLQRQQVVDKHIKQNDGAAIDAQAVFSSIPVFLNHCSDDSVVEPELGRELHEILKSLGTRVEWQEYADGGHWIKEPEAMDDFAAFLEELKTSNATF